MYPLMMQRMREGNISVERLVDAISTRPAKILGLRDRGRIAPGLRADLAIFDVHSETKMTEDSCHYKCGWNPYAGFSAIFPKHVLFKGGFLVREGNFEGEKGEGSLVF
jgi:dihydroorotase